MAAALVGDVAASMARGATVTTTGAENANSAVGAGRDAIGRKAGCGIGTAMSWLGRCSTRALLANSACRAASDPLASSSGAIT